MSPFSWLAAAARYAEVTHRETMRNLVISRRLVELAHGAIDVAAPAPLYVVKGVIASEPARREIDARTDLVSYMPRGLVQRPPVAVLPTDRRSLSRDLP